MAGQRSKDKKLIQAWVPITLYVQLEAEAQRTGRTKTDIIVKSLREHFRIDPIPASSAQLDEIRTALVQLGQTQRETMRLIQEQPIAALPEPEPQPEPEKRGFWSRLFG